MGVPAQEILNKEDMAKQKPEPQPRNNLRSGGFAQSFAQFTHELLDRPRQNTVMVKPTKQKRSPPRLPVNFEKRIIELEFKIEKGQAGQEQIHELVDMYNKASSHYDKVKDKDQAEIYR